MKSGSVPRGSKDVQFVLGFQAELAKTSAYLLHDGEIFSIGDVRIRSKLKVLPFLVHHDGLAVDDLGDLFDVLVKLDQLAASYGALITVQLHGSSKEV